MSNNSLGRNFVVTSFGESHGEAVGVVIDGCPSGIHIDIDFIQSQLNRRRPGQSELTTSRKEQDQLRVLSGTIDNISTGAPICLLIENKNQQRTDYEVIKDIYRPSHADFTYEKKYGLRDPYGGGRSSARVTASWVAAGALANQLLREKHSIEITAFVSKIHSISMPDNNQRPDGSDIEKSPVRCPDSNTSKKMEKAVLNAKASGDSLGGIVTCIINNVPVGLGEPVFNKLQAQLAHAMLNINAVKGFEYGSGFSSAERRGSELNDEWILENDIPKTKTNHSGGIQGGISNGMPIYFNVAFKPTSSIAHRQKTLNSDLENVELSIGGRHDPCVVPRAVPIVENLVAIILLDNLLFSA